MGDATPIRPPFAGAPQKPKPGADAGAGSASAVTSPSSADGPSADDLAPAPVIAEESFRLVLESSHDCIKVLDGQGRLLYMSPGGRSLLGIADLGPYLGRSWLDFWRDPEDRAAAAQALAEAAGGRPGAFRGLCPAQDGTDKWWDVLITPMTGQGGDGRLLAISRDITESRRVERELRESQERERSRAQELEAVMEAVPAVVWIAHDADARLITGSRASYDFLRIPYGANASKSAPQDPPRHFRVYRDGAELGPEELPIQLAARGQEVRNFEEEVVFDDGTSRHLFGHATPLKDARGDIRGAVGAFIDITDLKRAERALREQQARSDFLAEASRILGSSLSYPESLAQVAELAVPAIADRCAFDLLSQGGAFERLSPAFAASLPRLELLLGEAADRDELLREHRTLHLVAGAAEDSEAAGPGALRRPALGELGIGSLLIAPLVSRGQLLGVLTLASGESRRSYGEQDLKLARQLAERSATAVDNARLFAETRALNAELEQRVRQRTAELEATHVELEAFSYSVSHDLRAPLRGIDGFSQALLDDHAARLDDSAVRYLHRIRAAVSRMSELMDALLVLARLSRQPARPTLVRLDELALEVVAALQEAEPERRVEVEISAGLVVRADRHLLRIALENLLSNAWKFTRQRRDARVTVGSDSSSGETVYFVRDNGAGFDMRYAGKLFVAFQRLHSPGQFEGTGIGLATVQRIIHRHGGRLWAEGEVGRGATFYFTLAA